MLLFAHPLRPDPATPLAERKPIDLSHCDASGHERQARTGNPDGPLAGETIVFTGALTMPRREAADLAAQAGCDVADNVNKETTLLVVGNQDIRMAVELPGPIGVTPDARRWWTSF